MKKTTIALLVALTSFAIMACKNDNSNVQNNEEQNTEITADDTLGEDEDDFDLDTSEGRIANFKQQAEGLLKSYLETQSIEDADAVQEDFETVLPVLAESLTEEDMEQIKPWNDAFLARADKEMKAHRDKLTNE